MKYADVILPLPLENSYTYSIPPDLEQTVIPGCRVIVHFGKKRYYTAIVMDVHDRVTDSQYETKEIYALLDATPVLRRPQLRFWKWIQQGIDLFCFKIRIRPTFMHIHDNRCVITFLTEMNNDPATGSASYYLQC